MPLSSTWYFGKCLLKQSFRPRLHQKEDRGESLFYGSEVDEEEEGWGSGTFGDLKKEKSKKGRWVRFYTGKKRTFSEYLLWNERCEQGH